MEHYLVTYYTKYKVVSRAFLLKSDAMQFYEKVISRKSVEFSCLDLDSDDYRLNRLKTYRK